MVSLIGNTSGPSFESSAIRAYTGPYGADGPPVSGTAGASGDTGAAGGDGPKGLTGPTGSTILGTFFQTRENDPNFNYWVIRFLDENGIEATASPRGLTGKPGPVVGGTAHFANTGGGETSIFINEAPYGVSWGTNITTGISGATLTFKRICSSGDIVLYYDHLLGIGTGATHTMIGISGPVANFFGGITSNSIGELAYLADRKNAKDAHGLTFTAVGLTAGAGDDGLTWGTITTKFVNHSEFFHIHGNAINGVEDDSFHIKTNTGNVHLIYAPFNLKGITMDFHADRNPIVNNPSWDGITGGETAEYGESINVTLIIDGGPRGIQFGEGFYMPKDGVTFTPGRDILNCLSYDNGKNWFVTPAGFGYGISGPPEDVTALGCCCNAELETCEDFITRLDCINQGDGYFWNANSSCEQSCQYGVTEEDEVDILWGSCCLNKNNDTESDEAACIDFGANSGPTADWMTREKCEKFGGLFRRLIPCTDEFPCGDPCDENFGLLGACCQFNGEGLYIGCDRYTAYECGVLLEEPAYTIYQGDNTFCEKTSCCSYEGFYGACCTRENTCLDQMRPLECREIEGTYMGHDSTCDTVSCACPEVAPIKSACINCGVYSEGGSQYDACVCCNAGEYEGCINTQYYGDPSTFYSFSNFCDEFITTPSGPGGYPTLNLAENAQEGLINMCPPDATPEEIESFAGGCLSQGGAGEFDTPSFEGYSFIIYGHCCWTEKQDDNTYQVYCEDRISEGACDAKAYDDNITLGDIRWSEYKLSNLPPEYSHLGACSCARSEGGGTEYCGEIDENGKFIEGTRSSGDGGDQRSGANIPGAQVGSCCIYPIIDSCTKDLDFSCFNVTESTCSNIENKFNKTYGYGSYGVKFTLGKCCCTEEECGGTTSALPKGFPSLSFNDCLLAVNGPLALECGGPCRDSRTMGTDCQFRENACVFHCNCSATGVENVRDDSSFVKHACCSCDPDCDETKSRNNFCSNSPRDPNCRTSCENCAITAFTTGGACCCKDYSDDGLPECPECSSCTYMTEQECTQKRYERNLCPDPLGQDGSYECDCSFYPDTTCGELAQDGLCDAASEEASNLEYKPIVIPIRGSRSAPKIVAIDGIQPVPAAREQLSGILCSSSGCETIFDVYEYIVAKGSWFDDMNENQEYQVFFPYTPEIYSHLSEFSVIPQNQNGREHFIQMSSIGGHGITRPLSIDEMFIQHSSEMNANLTKDHFMAMKMVYETEKTIMQSDPAGFYDWYTASSDLNDYCGCGNFDLTEISMKQVAVKFPVVNSPISGTDCIEIIVPKHTENFVARRLGGVVSGTSCSTARSHTSTEIKSTDSVTLNMQRMKMETPSGRCSFPDGKIITCSQEYCESSGGTWKIKSINIKNSDNYQKYRTRRSGTFYKTKQRETGPFDLNGYYPLYDTAEGARNASPDPGLVRDGETTAGYHTHTINQIVYYMPNGLVMGETQFHGDYVGQDVDTTETSTSPPPASGSTPPTSDPPSSGGSSNTYGGGY
jgi:hypothetical protein